MHHHPSASASLIFLCVGGGSTTRLDAFAVASVSVSHRPAESSLLDPRATATHQLVKWRCHWCRGAGAAAHITPGSHHSVPGLPALRLVADECNFPVIPFGNIFLFAFV